MMDKLEYQCNNGDHDEFIRLYEETEKTNFIPIGTVLKFMSLITNSFNAMSIGINNIQKFLRNKLFTLNGAVNLRRVALVHRADINMACKGYTDLLLYKYFVQLNRDNKPFDETALFILQNVNFININNYITYGLIGRHHTEKDIIGDPQFVSKSIKGICYEELYVKFHIDIFIELGLMKDSGNILYRYMKN